MSFSAVFAVVAAWSCEAEAYERQWQAAFGLGYSQLYNGGGTGAAKGGGILSKLMPRMPPSAPRRNAAGAKGDSGDKVHQVWVLEAGVAVPVTVTTGISDGLMTEVAGDGLQAGMAVITDQLSAAAP